jgi:hypothetical protein
LTVPYKHTMGGRKKKIGANTDGEVVEREKKPQYCWSSEMESFNLNLIIQGIRAGKRQDGHWKDQFWHDCVNTFANNGFRERAGDGDDGRRQRRGLQGIEGPHLSSFCTNSSTTDTTPLPHTNP